MKNNWLVLFLISVLLPLFSNAQFFIISTIHRPENDTMSVFSISIRNTSRDSMLVLHSQETESPPFINKYRFEVRGEDTTIIYFGKSLNPLIPETYRATKTIGPRNTLEVYFSIPKSQIKKKKSVLIYFSMISEKYLEDFNKLDRMENNANIKRCRKLKERFGSVYHKEIYY